MQRFFYSVRYLDSDSSELSRKSVACSKAGHICAPTHSKYAGTNLILFCPTVHTDYHNTMLTSNRSVSETEIQRMFTAATLNWSYVYAQEIYEVSRGGHMRYCVFYTLQNTEQKGLKMSFILFQGTE